MKERVGYVSDLGYVSKTQTRYTPSFDSQWETWWPLVFRKRQIWGPKVQIFVVVNFRRIKQVSTRCVIRGSSKYFIELTVLRLIRLMGGGGAYANVAKRPPPQFWKISKMSRYAPRGAYAGDSMCSWWQIPWLYVYEGGQDTYGIRIFETFAISR